MRLIVTLLPALPAAACAVKDPAVPRTGSAGNEANCLS
jgi:hypothetical protein